MEALQAVATKPSIALIPVKVKNAEEIRAGVTLAKKQSDALYIVSDALFNNSRKEIAELALSLGLPSVYGFKEIVSAGALMSYGPEFLALFRRAADFVDKILGGERPSDIPVEQPVIYELVLNLSTAVAEPEPTQHSACPRRRGDRVGAPAAMHESVLVPD